MRSIYYEVVDFSKNYGEGGRSDINAGNVREMLEKSYLPCGLHQSNHSLQVKSGFHQPRLCANAYLCLHACGVPFPTWNHHLLLQTLPLTPKMYTKDEEIRAIMTLQGCARNMLKSHALLIKKLVTTGVRCHLTSGGNENPGLGDVLNVSESD